MTEDMSRDERGGRVASSAHEGRNATSVADPVPTGSKEHYEYDERGYNLPRRPLVRW